MYTKCVIKATTQHTARLTVHISMCVHYVRRYILYSMCSTLARTRTAPACNDVISGEVPIVKSWLIACARKTRGLGGEARR